MQEILLWNWFFWRYAGILLCIMMPLVNIDPLTGLPNYVYAIDMLRHLIHFPANSIELSVGVVFFDIFGLKTPHDNYGHQPVDDVLCAVADTLRAIAHQNEVVCRIGGDEFLLISPSVNEAEIQQRAQEVREAVQRVRIVANGEPREHLVASVGVARHSDISARSPASKLRGPEALMRDADVDLMRDRERNVARRRESKIGSQANSS